MRVAHNVYRRIASLTSSYPISAGFRDGDLEPSSGAGTANGRMCVTCTRTGTDQAEGFGEFQKLFRSASQKSGP
jgi:hypothetical protein